MSLAKGGDRLCGGKPVCGQIGHEDVGALIGQGQVDVAAALETELLEQGAERRDHREQFWRENVAFAHIDDGVALLGGEAQQDAAPLALDMQRRAAAGLRRRDERRAQQRGQPLRLQCAGDAIGDEGGVGFVVEMLELAAAAFGEMAARRRLVMRAAGQRAIGAKQIAGRREGGMATVGSDAIATGGDADNRIGGQNRIGIGHAPALTGVSAFAKSSAMKLAPSRRAAWA